MIVAGDEGRRRGRWHRGKQRCLHCGLPADGDHHRGWPASILSSEEKVRLVGEVAERGVAEVARRYEVCRSLLYRWRRQMRRGELAAVAAAAGFVPVRIAPELPSPPETKDELPAAPLQNTLASEASIRLVEIVLGNGRVLRVAERIDPAVLARLAAALDRR
jgi:transposase